MQIQISKEQSNNSSNVGMEDEFLLSSESLDVGTEDEFLLSSKILDIGKEDKFLLQNIKDRYIQQFYDTYQHPSQLNIFIDFVKKAEFNQASVFFLGLCGVSKDRLGNIHLGNVNLGTGEGVTDKCLSVHVLKVIAKNIPQDNYFVCKDGLPTCPRRGRQKYV